MRWLLTFLLFGSGGSAALAGLYKSTATTLRVTSQPSQFEGLNLAFEVPTPEQIGIYLTATRSVALTARVLVRFREAGTATWREGHPMLRIRPEWTDGGAPQAPIQGFAGTVFDLKPGTAYDLELRFEEPSKAAQVVTTTVMTRALPAAAPAATVTATPSDNLQTKLNGLQAGQVLQLANGTYNVNGLVLNRSGTKNSPIIIRGQSRTGVILANSTDTILEIQAANHVILENMTLQGSGVDSGTDSRSVGIELRYGDTQDDVTIRDIDIKGVDQGIVAWTKTLSIMVYNCTLTGNNVWTEAFLSDNRTWNDDGIRLPGEGNVAFENTLHGFGDTFAVNNGTHSSGVYFYRNKITMTGDDAFEADYGTRNLGFYDNYIGNSSTFVSLDPLWGGPLYCFRNVSINTTRGPFKLNSTNSGFMIYNNTIVRTTGRHDWGWVQYNNGDLQNWSFRNNILLYRGTGTQLIAVESGGMDLLDFSHNAFYPDGSIWWSNSGGSFNSLAAALAGLPATAALFGSSTKRHFQDQIVPSDLFANPIQLGSDYLTEYKAMAVPVLKSGVSAKSSGVAIPNVTDGFTGALPDRGALIEGRPTPAWGARR